MDSAPDAGVVPDLSIVIPAVNGRAILLECLEALGETSAADLTLELIVVDRCGAAAPSLPWSGHGQVVTIAVPESTTIPRMREIAMHRASAEAVAVIEDHVLVPPTWARELLAALAEGADVVGGSVVNGATQRTTDWAAFLCEYSHLLPPLPEGPVDALTGNNVVYRRSVLQNYWDVVAAGRWEDHLHAAMRREGVPLVCRPGICVRHKMHYRVHEYLLQRFLYSRGHAGLRATDMSAAQRAFFAVATLALPGMLLVRIVRRVVATRRLGAELARSLPLISLFVCAWAGGEAVGYVAGPGRSLSLIK